MFSLNLYFWAIFFLENFSNNVHEVPTFSRIFNILLFLKQVFFLFSEIFDSFSIFQKFYTIIGCRGQKRPVLQ